MIESPLPKDLVWQHMAHVWGEFQRRFIARHFDELLASRVRMNRHVLVEAIAHGLKDLDRMATWHLPEKDQLPDQHKYSGFLAKWIARFRPVYLHPVPARALPIEANMVNAYFALWVFRYFLERDVPENLHPNLVYSFHFREERGETLSLIAYTCEAIVD